MSDITLYDAIDHTSINNKLFILKFKITSNIICFGFKKTNREISTAGGEVIYLYIFIYFP